MGINSPSRPPARLHGPDIHFPNGSKSQSRPAPARPPQASGLPPFPFPGRASSGPAARAPRAGANGGAVGVGDGKGRRGPAGLCPPPTTRNIWVPGTTD